SIYLTAQIRKHHTFSSPVQRVSPAGRVQRLPRTEAGGPPDSGPSAQELTEVGRVVLPGQGFLIPRIGAFALPELAGVDAAAPVRSLLDPQMGVEHLVEHDVANEVSGYEILVEQGMNADEVVFHRVAAEANRPATAAGRHAAPSDARPDLVPEVQPIHLVVE